MRKEKAPRYGMGQNVRFMLRLAWTCGERKVLLLSLLSALLAVARNLIELYVSPAILSVVERQAGTAELLGTIALFAAALLLVSAAFQYVDVNTIFGRISVRGELVAQLNRKAATTSYPNLFDETYQNLNAKAQETVGSNEAATEAVWTTLTDLCADLLGFLFYVCLLSTAQPLLMLLVLGTTALSYLLGHRLSEWGYRHREEEAEYEKQMAYLSARARDLSAAKDIRLFGLRPWIEELYRKAMDAFTAFHQKAQSVYLWAALANLLLSFLRSAVAYAYLIGLVLREGLGVAEFLLYFTAIGGFTTWVTGILEGLNTLHKQSLDISTVRECLDYPEPFRFAGGEPIAAEPGRQYELRLEDVSFRYPGAERDTLSHIDLTLHPGEKLAVVGLNGAGKSTLIKLLCGFLDPTGGRVLLDGRDIRRYDRQAYYTMFSAVFQDFVVLPGSIEANVAQDGDSIDRERVISCLRRAGLGEKLAALPEGCETLLRREVYQEAVQFSGGETQRLMLARALYKDAPFIVLDEPTAALDPIAESELYRKYDEMTGGRSSVYISHRLASTRFCDRIIMLADGGICEEGTHEELLRKKGSYAALYEVQSRYYREGGEEA